MADESKTPLYEDLHCDNEDAEKKAAYLLYPDGHREYVDKPPEKVPASAGLAPQNQVQWE